MLFKKLVASGLVTLCCSAWADGEPSVSMAELLSKVKEGRAQVTEVNKERETRFRRDKRSRAGLLKEADAENREVEQLSRKLKAAFDRKEKEIVEAQKKLDERSGELKELFGVVRSISGDLASTLRQSMVSAQYPNRTDFLDSLAQSKEVPASEDLRILWFLIQQEMTESGRVTQFDQQVIGTDGESRLTAVTRVGTFALSTDDRFLQYVIGGTIEELTKQPARRYRKDVQQLSQTTSGIGPAYVDPTRGTLFSLLRESPSLMERVKQGGPVGYVILALGSLGLLIAAMRLMVLSVVSIKFRSQAKNISEPRQGNALGRVLSVYQEGDEKDLETLELKLQEAILKEVPKLERGQNVLKLLAAVSPLLGLLGTVTGMILTFHSITLFGTGDPKLMAGGISQALVTTVLGLVAAIPLLFAHATVAARSRAMVHVLEEQSAGLLARRLEK
ncbi:MAG: biopolymer transport protein ExbB [Gammaproteobacteria bacterium]|jgi:biopolymer transport protein ExbB